jgi:YHS domain-containing protein
MGHGHSSGEKSTPGAPTCPVSGHEVSSDHAVVISYEGKEIQLCCADCEKPFLADPAKYMANWTPPQATTH